MQARFLSCAVFVVSVFGFVPVVQAASPTIPTGGISDVSQLSGQDEVVLQDFNNFQQFGLKDRFGLTFHTHKDVCAKASSGKVGCNARVITDSANVPLATTTSPYPSALSPAQLLKGYALSGTTAKQQVIAIVDAYDDPNVYADLTTYSQQYGLPVLPQCVGAASSSSVPCFQKMNQKGQTVSYPTVDAGWSLEIALDVEAAHAICQNCTILLVEATSNSFADLTAADDQAVAQGAKIVSNSWSAGEFSGENTYDTHFYKPGVVFLFSTGDNGYGVQYPAASPYVTAVGGTSLLLNTDGSYNSETAWSGAGSGCSAYETKPVWQTDLGCAKRTVADVSADADPNTGASIYDTVPYGTSSATGWFQVGGTSLAAPLIAGVYALAGNPSVSTAMNALPYGNASLLHDVTSGSNGTCNGSYLCTAKVGFDGPTGLGTPNGVGAFVYSATAVAATLAANPTTIISGQSSTLTWNSTNASSCIGTNFSTGSQTSGSIAVSPTVTTSYSVSCTGVGGTKVASATVTVTSVPAPTATLTANPTSIRRGQSSKLTWSSANATSCTGTNFSTGGKISGSTSVVPTKSTTYYVSCSGAGGTVVKSASVSVR